MLGLMMNRFLPSQYLRLKKQPVIPWLCSSLGGCYKQTEAGNKNLLWDAVSLKQISMGRHCWIEEAEKDSIVTMKTFLHLLIKDLVQEEFIHVETRPPHIVQAETSAAKHLLMCSYLPQLLQLSRLLCVARIFPQNLERLEY